MPSKPHISQNAIFRWYLFLCCALENLQGGSSGQIVFWKLLFFDNICFIKNSKTWLNCYRSILQNLSEFYDLYHFTRKQSMTNKNTWLGFFLLVALLNMLAEWNINQLLIYVSKPLLMVTLAVYFALAAREQSSTFRTLILVGLIFAFGGDTLLMFAGDHPNGQTFFTLGLGSFLITQMCYMLAFLKYNTDEKGLLQKMPGLILLFLGLLLANIYYLWPDLPGGLKIPVAAYSTVIIGMFASCVNLSGRIPKAVFSTLLLGVILFVISDSTIALNKFKANHFTIPYSRILIMGTYIAAQYFIATSSTKLVNLLKVE